MEQFASSLRFSVIDPADVLPVRFYVLLGNEPARVSVKPDNNLVEVFARLQEYPTTSRFIPPNTASSDYTFYKLINPVLFVAPELQEDDTFIRQARQKCKEVENRLRVEPTTTVVRTLAEQLLHDHAHLVIEPRNKSPNSINGIEELRRDYPILFRCLQVTVQRLAMWNWMDVNQNQKGGVFANDIDVLSPEFGETVGALSQPRWYRTSDLENNPDFQLARMWYQTQFERIFMPIESNSHATVCSREVGAFYSVLQCFNDHVLRLAGHDVPRSLKASNFTVNFLQPPFFSLPSCKLRYQQNRSWGFPIFVDAIDPPNVFRKLVPRSDCMVFSPRFDIPFVICEVVSDELESDCSRMAVQAIALTRAGQFLLRSGSKQNFFVVALYVDADMVVTQYITMQTEGGDEAEGDKPVAIHEQKFDLRDKDQQVDFLRQMYNLSTRVAALSDELDLSKGELLRDIHKASSGLRSFSNEGQKTMGNTTMITEGSSRTRELDEEDNLGIFEAEDIQSILHQMEYEIEFIPYGHPHLAVIVSKTGDRHGYFKFVEQDRKEVNILQYLTGIQSPSNHTISGIQFWSVEGGTVISMPVAGGWLTSLTNRSEHLWSVALQLVEAVAFMHEHNVAHMDLKPRNIIIPPEGGRLSVIDFSVSILVQSPDAMYRGVVGTEDYIAPEVRKGQYKPILADLWSCGRTLEDLCAGCHPSADRTTLLEISRELMDRDPEGRPKMSTVLERMTSIGRGGNTVSHMTMAFPTVHTLAHEHSLLPLSTGA